MTETYGTSREKNWRDHIVVVKTGNISRRAQLIHLAALQTAEPALPVSLYPQYTHSPSVGAHATPRACKDADLPFLFPCDIAASVAQFFAGCNRSLRKL
jgi:hypothetical protein